VPTDAPESNNASKERTTPETTAALEDGKPEASESNKDAPGNKDEAPNSSYDTPDESTASVPSSSKPPHNRQPSLSIQSKMRSSSFRRTSISQGPMSPSQNGPRSPSLPLLSPEGDAVTDIYRKQASRLDELERENRRLAKEAAESSTRWKCLETELEELRESSGELAELRSRAQATSSKDAEISHLQNENTSLNRQLSQLQSSTSKRHASSPSSQPPPSSSPSSSSLQTQLDSKTTTVDSMEMEISTLRSQLSTATTTSTSHREQIAALEEKVDRAERAAGSAQRELLDVRKNLDRASENAVRDGSERTSAETKLRSLTREAEESNTRAEDATKRIDTLEKKLAALTTLHKDSDSRRQASEKQHSLLECEAAEMRRRLASIENENLQLREARDRHRNREVSGDADGMDELEDEERQRLEQKVRSLETEVFELRRGVWRDKRREMSGSGPASPGGGKFDDVDLTGPNVSSPFGARRQSMASGFTNALSNGFSAFTGGGRRGSDALLSDEGGEFDEEAWRRAQEEEGRKRVERVREVKRGLKGWEGWRMDLVDVRGGVAGLGEVFDV